MQVVSAKKCRPTYVFDTVQTCFGKKCSDCNSMKNHKKICNWDNQLHHSIEVSLLIWATLVNVASFDYCSLLLKCYCILRQWVLHEYIPYTSKHFIGSIINDLCRVFTKYHVADTMWSINPLSWVQVIQNATKEQNPSTGLFWYKFRVPHPLHAKIASGSWSVICVGCLYYFWSSYNYRIYLSSILATE